MIAFLGKRCTSFAITIDWGLSQARSGKFLLTTDLLLVTCSLVLPVSWSGCRRLNWLPLQALLNEEGVWTPSRNKNIRPVKGRMNSL